MWEAFILTVLVFLMAFIITLGCMLLAEMATNTDRKNYLNSLRCNNIINYADAEERKDKISL